MFYNQVKQVIESCVFPYVTLELVTGICCFRLCLLLLYQLKDVYIHQLHLKTFLFCHTLNLLTGVLVAIGECGWEELGCS